MIGADLVVLNVRLRNALYCKGSGASTGLCLHLGKAELGLGTFTPCPSPPPPTPRLLLPWICPTLVLLPGKSQGWRSLVGCSPWGH